MYNFDFNDDMEALIAETKKILRFEHPQWTEWGGDAEFNIMGSNVDLTRDMKEISREVDNFNDYAIYQYSSGNNIIDLFTIKDFTAAIFKYIKNDDIIINKSVWQYQTKKGLCRDIVFNYYLNRKCKVFISDKMHTLNGKSFWEKLIQEALNEQFDTFVLKNDTDKIPLNDIADMEKYYTNDKFGQQFRLGINK